MTHADRIREAERAVVAAAVAVAGTPHDRMNDGGSDCFNGCAACAADIALHAAVDALLALRAETCPTCGGEGSEDDPASMDGRLPCSAGCERGRRRTT